MSLNVNELKYPNYNQSYPQVGSNYGINQGVNPHKVNGGLQSGTQNFDWHNLNRFDGSKVNGSNERVPFLSVTNPINSPVKPENTSVIGGKQDFSNLDKELQSVQNQYNQTVKLLGADENDPGGKDKTQDKGQYIYLKG